MGKNVQERVQKHREKLKQDPEKYIEHKKKDAERKKRERKAKTLTPPEILEQRAKNRARVARHRLKKKSSENDPLRKVYKTPQALGKAVQRLKRALPYSPRKRKLVINLLTHQEKVQPTPKPKKLSPNEITPEVIAAIHEIYQRDDISRSCPGKKDVIVEKSGIFKMKRYLVMTIDEAYQLFKTENPDKKVGKSKFAEERPSHVIKIGETPRNVCLCRQHENLVLQLQALHKVLPDLFPLYSTTFPSQCVCVMQISIFTAMVWSKSFCQSFALVTDCLDHDKHAVNCFVTYLMSTMKEMIPDLGRIAVFSDGAASQFKNKFIFQLLCYLQEKLHLQISWHYFATSHGKGAVDGIGGIIKRMATNAVNSRRAVIMDAASFVAATSDQAQKMKVIHLTQEDIEEAKKANTESLWEDVRTLPGTQNSHFISPKLGNTTHIIYKTHSSADEQKIHQLRVSGAQGSRPRATLTAIREKEKETEETNEIGDTEEKGEDNDITEGGREDAGNITKGGEVNVNITGGEDNVNITGEDNVNITGEDNANISEGEDNDNITEGGGDNININDFVAVRVAAEGKKTKDKLFVAKIVLFMGDQDHVGLTYMVASKDIYTWPGGDEQVYVHPKSDIITKLQEPSILVVGTRISFQFDLAKAFKML